MTSFWACMLLPVFWLLAGCEKEISIVPEAQPPKLVVDGSIENGAAPFIILTNSLDYFSELNADDLIKAFVKDAVVTLSDGQRTVPLRPYTVPVPGGLLFYYTTNNANPSETMVGKLNTNYLLTISVNGENYEAKTLIGAPLRRTDSLWWEPAPNNPDTNKVVVFSRVTDPPGLGNYIRYFTNVNDSAYVPGLNSVFDDQFVDGTTYDIQIIKGENRNADIDEESFGYFRRGDTVDFKISNIDKATFDFWRTWEQNQQNIGNPFGVPIKVLGNISNGALGYFGGYASQVRRILIPK